MGQFMLFENHSFELYKKFLSVKNSLSWFIFNYTFLRVFKHVVYIFKTWAKILILKIFLKMLPSIKRFGVSVGMLIIQIFQMRQAVLKILHNFDFTIVNFMNISEVIYLD